MVIETLNTNRLILRKLTPEVYNYVFKELSTSQGINFLGLKTEDDFEKEKEKFIKGLTTHNKKLLYFLLIDKETDKVIGWCGYHTYYIDHDRAELGYGLFDDSYKGKGIMTEALREVLKYGFEQMNLHRVEAMIGKNNLPSLNLVKKLNFVFEGTLREHYKVNNIPEDSMVFSLLNKEFSYLHSQN